VFLKIQNLLTPLEVARLMALSREMQFVEGRASNPANVTKENLQADVADGHYAESVQLVGAAFSRSREFVDFAMPRRIAPPLISRYGVGMKYGEHADAAIMNLPAGRLRSDLSCTVFLSDLSSYSGGELSLELGNQAIAFKGQPGEAIVYPSTTLHEVLPVTAGERVVSITFIESMIPDLQHRTLVYQLNEIAALEGNRMSWDGRVRLDVVRQNLIRMWATP
jgi:PKHD-type hydroxylase